MVTVLKSTKPIIMKKINKIFLTGRSPTSDGSQSSTSSLPPRLKEEASDETPVSPPPQTDSIPLLISGSDPLQRKGLGTSNLSHTQPRAETRKTGTCYFCKKAFMKNKQVNDDTGICSYSEPLKVSRKTNLHFWPKDWIIHHSTEYIENHRPNLTTPPNKGVSGNTRYINLGRLFWRTLSTGSKK